MNSNGQKSSHIYIEAKVKRILADGCLTRREYFDLVTLFLSDLSITEKQRFYINQLLDELQLGNIHFV
jgi:hypothetical protein